MTHGVPIPSASPTPVQTVCPALAADLRSQVAVPLGTGQHLLRSEGLLVWVMALTGVSPCFAGKTLRRLEKAADLFSWEGGKLVPSPQPRKWSGSVSQVPPVKPRSPS